MTRRQRRNGFTLVEILVAMALTIFILTILAECFIVGADMFRGLKSVGDLNGSLRTATNILRSDLSADHFEGKRRLSDSKFWTAPNNGPPQQGYFYLEQNQALTANEGFDADGFLSRRCAGHKLAFTVKARGSQPQNYYSAKIPGGPLGYLAQLIGKPDGRYQDNGFLSSQWVEVYYFLAPVNATADGTQLYALYRQQRLLLSTNETVNWNTDPGFLVPVAIWATTYASRFSCMPNPNPAFAKYLYFNSPADLTIPERRQAGKATTRLVAGVPVLNVGGTFAPIVDATNQPTGEDLLLTDVLSFDVQALLSTDTTQFNDLPAPYYFDTWSRRHDDVYDYSTAAIPNSSYRIQALKITIRIYDSKTKLARQITMIQDM